MNPLIKKEIRLLLPAWIAAMLLAIVPMWIASISSYGPPEQMSYVLLALALGLILLGITSFGQEFSSGTFTLLLSQPIERQRLWFIKTTVLATAIMSVLLTPVVSWEFYSFHFLLNRLVILTILKHVGLTLLCAFTLLSSGLWVTLLLRRISEAFWITLLTPLAIMVTLYAFHEYFHWSNQTDNFVIPTILLLYSLAGFFGARRLFLQAQDLQSTGGVIVFPSRKGIAELTTSSSRRRHWFSALVWKELQLQQVNILIAAVVLTLHLASVVIRQVHPNFASANIGGMLEQVWALWLLMPLLIGSAAVAEERRDGTMESQLCLPLSRRTQLFTKFSVALVLSLILGGLMPFVIEWTRDFNGFIFVVATAIFFISFYASTVARTTLQAIGLAIIVTVAIYFYVVATTVSVFKLGGAWSYERVGLELLKLYLGVPILVLVLAWLMYWNFKWLHPEGKLRWRNGIAVLASFAFIFVATNGVYFRAWEFLTPIEPPHGPARLSASKTPKLLFSGDTIPALLPDGRLWTEQIVPNNFGGILPDLNTQRFIGGSNWVDAASDFYRIVGIQSDGSLWSVQTYHGYPGTPAYPLTRIGSSTNWFQVAGAYGFLLLKDDRTLWYWGVHDNSLSSAGLQKYLTAPPQRIGDGTNWTEVFGRYARKSDGSIWALSFTRQIPHLEQAQDENESLGFISYASAGWGPVGVKTNGELLLLVYQPDKRPKEIQLGKNAKWKAVAFISDDSIIAIRSDGTLWEWLLPFWRFSGSAKPDQLGTYAGWIALHSTGDWPPESIALAADGSLWVWKDPSKHRWLAPSRKPVFLGNVFGKAD